MSFTTIQQFLNEAKIRLSPVTDFPLLEAEVLLAHLLNKPRSFIRAWPETSLTKDQRQQGISALIRRMHKEPLAYIVGRREFCSLNFFVNAHTLIPRPETELLVECALALIDENAKLMIADLGTGSGAIGLSLAYFRPLTAVYAADISEEALKIARKNKAALAINNISFCAGSWCSALPHIEFDIIVSNPPYIAECEWHTYSAHLAYEPTQALLSGRDGLEAIREISQNAKNYLKSGGYLLIEHGFLQGRIVREIFTAAGYTSIYTFRDLSGHERVTRGQIVF